MSGSFTYLPLHAAAPRDSQYVHSYTSTLSALIQARNRHGQAKKVIGKSIAMTAVGVSEIPEKPFLRLSSVTEEIDKIREIVGAHQTHILLNESASVENVSTSLTTSAFLHLACHGQQYLKDPLKSSLLLYNGTLELEKILHMSLPGAQFVFLSACQTATGDAKLANESMHLAGGLIFAGFQGAIGTLWSISDPDGPKIAETVYNHLFPEGGSPDITHAAKALQMAVDKLRDEGAPYQRWIPYIHIGI